MLAVALDMPGEEASRLRNLWLEAAPARSRVGRLCLCTTSLLNHAAEYFRIELAGLGFEAPEFRLRHSRMVFARQFVGVKGHPDRVFPKLIAHPVVPLRFLDVVNRQLNAVIVGIAIVQ